MENETVSIDVPLINTNHTRDDYFDLSTTLIDLKLSIIFFIFASDRGKIVKRKIKETYVVTNRKWLIWLIVERQQVQYRW